MAENVQLDEAAKRVGKSEVTIRRLIKAKKVPSVKEKTPTGFIYMVDPDHVAAYYKAKDGSIFDQDFAGPVLKKTDTNQAALPIENDTPAKQAPQHEPESEVTKPSGPTRVAVAGEDGSQITYWQKRAERYEDRYHAQLEKFAGVREELGLWRGRAEQAQSMLVKLLPAPNEVAITQDQKNELVKNENSNTFWITILVVVVLVGVLLFVIKSLFLT